MDALKELKKNLEKQIEEINKKNDITPTELERLDKAVDIIKDIETICAMKEYDDQQWRQEEGYSGRYYPMYMRDERGGNSRQSYDMWDEGSYQRDRSYAPDMYMSRNSYGDYPYSYNRGGSYRNSYDRNSYNRGYSGHNNKEDLKMDLKMMMDNAKSDKERMAIQQLLEQWKE